MNVGEVRGHLAREKGADVAIQVGNGDRAGAGRPKGLRYEVQAR